MSTMLMTSDDDDDDDEQKHANSSLHLRPNPTSIHLGDRVLGAQSELACDCARRDAIGRSS